MLGTRQTSGKGVSLEAFSVFLFRRYLGSIGLVYLPTFANANQPKM